ncbi:MAG TPA: energy-coupling factor ABC transporter ATP-binding protein [Candidatus Acidoferrales bacterium]|nr:energy-coupling factor ABC transporter ATP-binding protein [Candidatus Acidoferrales bacterium]
MLFEVDCITYSYPGQTALRDLSLTIPEGIRAALLGANGSGKSTLLRLLDGLYFPDSGTVRFRGEELIEEHFADDAFAYDFRRQVGMVFQNPDVQLFNPTVFDEVAFGPLQLRWPKSQVRERVAEILDRLRISHLKDRIPHRLSGGEKKRVALASVLILDPAVLLLDEPTASLDPRSQSQFIDLLVAWGGGTKSVITATHDLGDIEDIADRCYVLDAGQLVADRIPSEVLRDTDLLRRTNLVHAHRHRHPTGEIHSHPHLHRSEE